MFGPEPQGSICLGLTHRVVFPFSYRIPNALVVEAELFLHNVLVGHEAVLTARYLALGVESEELKEKQDDDQFDGIKRCPAV